MATVSFSAFLVTRACEKALDPRPGNPTLHSVAENMIRQLMKVAKISEKHASDALGNNATVTLSLEETILIGDYLADL